VCCVCGFKKKRGVITGKLGAVPMRLFVCEDCLAQPFIYFPIKVYTPPKLPPLQLELVGRMLGEDEVS